ncbi:52 kDa repressor of the inhibitor of the protein kinase-like [Sipha flava]|uniref:52 kDa repressor of the inhibitor of the protein kinase-like n=1 Tax=Sipha flava TaxID=143950 RepID=A0A8B8GQW2_9HEMI|nr:52 kDa repressor of the inhibitor of the protein kinase-like [Sipha flava]
MTSSTGGIKCTLNKCHSVYNKNAVGNQKSFFNFPKDLIKCSLWIKKCFPVSLPTTDTSDIAKRYKLYSLNFENNMFSNLQKNRLYPHAVPNLFENTIFEQNLNTASSPTTMVVELSSIV